MIPTLAHGVLDYAFALLLIALPFLFGFADGSAAQWVPILLGLATILYSLLTRYELGAMGLIPMRAHLGLDVANGVILAASPFVLGFADRVYLPHLVVGLVEIVIPLLTRREDAPRFKAG